MADACTEDKRTWFRDLCRFRLFYSNKRWYRARRFQIAVILLFLTILVYFVDVKKDIVVGLDRNATRRHIEKRLADGLRSDKGTGCEVPYMAINQETTKLSKKVTPIRCSGMDWVRCWRSKCKVVPEILKSTTDITCRYRDVIYESDDKRHLGPTKEVRNAGSYMLVKSDHAKVVCLGKPRRLNEEKTKRKMYTKWSRLKWVGYVAGFRNTTRKTPPKGREKTLNVLILGLGSFSRNGFIRTMPKTYEYLTERLHATVLKGYNIVGDGTAAALFPILAGKTELELPDVRKVSDNPGTLDELPFIFNKLNEDGYRTAFFEDSPLSTFQHHFVGFRKQPTDHYLQPFLEEYQVGSKWKAEEARYCVGSTLRYKLIMNLTQQFLRLRGKRFIFTLLGDVCQDNFNVTGVADVDIVKFLNTLRKTGKFRDTLLIVMGDHESRFGYHRDTLQGKLEEKLPFVAILLPRDLRMKRPEVQKNLESNADALTTPHDVHATLLDALDWRQHWNQYKVPGADLPRALSLLESVPQKRSCSEAGIEAHWCSCLQWENVSENEPIYRRVADTLVTYINALTKAYRTVCDPRTLTSISWVMRQLPNKPLFPVVVSPLLSFGEAGGRVDVNREVYQVKIAMGPGVAIYESTLIYHRKEDIFDLNLKDILRINSYNGESHCVKPYPHLYIFCYCYD